LGVLVVRYQGFVVVCRGYFIGNFGLREKNKKKKRKKKVCVCVRERERELTLDFILFYFIFSVMQILSSQSDMYMKKETFQFNVTSLSDTNSVSGIEDQKHFLSALLPESDTR
jgi:hypothetical protein